MSTHFGVKPTLNSFCCSLYELSLGTASRYFEIRIKSVLSFYILVGPVTFRVGEPSRPLSCGHPGRTINVTGASFFNEGNLDNEICASIQRHRCIYESQCEFQRSWLGTPCLDLNLAVDLQFVCVPGNRASIHSSKHNSYIMYECKRPNKKWLL